MLICALKAINIISAPFFQGKKVNKPSPLLSPPPPPPPLPRNITSCGLIRNGLFTKWKFGFVIDPRLRDLQLLVLELFHFVSSSLWRTGAIVSKLNKPAGELERGFTVFV